jgi:hypothetical protein
MAINRYNGTYRSRSDVMDNITPNNVVITPTTGIAVPAGEFKPSAWLPVVWQGEASKDFFTISSGKVVSFEATGRVCPSGYKAIAAAAAAVGDTFVEYTALDVSAKTEDLRTGAALAAAGTVTIAAAATAILSRALVLEASLTWAGTEFDATSLADCKAVLAAFISDPVGVCSYDVYHWAGDQFDEERGLNNTNYQKQHLIQFFTQVQMQMPLGGIAAAAGVDLAGATAWNPATPSHGAVWPMADAIGTELYVTSTQLAGLSRYADSTRTSLFVQAGDAVVGYALQTDGSGARIARSTDRTPISDSNSILQNEKKSIRALRAQGDFFIDADHGLVLVFDHLDGDGSRTTPLPATSLSYAFYDTDAASTSWQQIAAVGDFTPGGYVTYDEYSNLAPGSAGDHIGRVLAVHVQPLGLLERVNTAWSGSSFDASAQMPGSATKGFTDLITLSNETVADKVLIVSVNCA